MVVRGADLVALAEGARLDEERRRQLRGAGAESTIVWATVSPANASARCVVARGGAVTAAGMAAHSSIGGSAAWRMDRYFSFLLTCSEFPSNPAPELKPSIFAPEDERRLVRVAEPRELCRVTPSTCGSGALAGRGMPL